MTDQLSYFQCSLKCLKTYSSRDSVIAIFMDISKAFDCVNHSILLNNLYAYEVGGKVNSSIESYLKNRQTTSHVN